MSWIPGISSLEKHCLHFFEEAHASISSLHERAMTLHSAHTTLFKTPGRMVRSFTVTFFL
jgi:hypothetical protein